MDKIKQFGYQLGSMMSRFLYGRNGYDNLARTCNRLALILLVVNIFAQSVVIYFMWVALFGYSIFRIYSKNITKRYAENQKFMSMTTVPRRYLNLLKLQWRDRNVSRYYLCKSLH